MDFKQDNLSYTNDSIKNVENYYRIAPLRGQFDINNFMDTAKSLRAPLEKCLTP